VINVSEVLDDPDFVDSYNVVRSVTSIVTVGEGAGELSTVTSVVSLEACVHPVRDAKDLLALPEGLRNSSAIHVYTQTAIYADAGDDGSAAPGPVTVDIFPFNGGTYKLHVVNDFSANGYYHGIGVRQP
jgi:hypothetical protein